MTCSLHFKKKKSFIFLFNLLIQCPRENPMSRRVEGMYGDPVYESGVAREKVESQGTVSRRQRPRQSFIPNAALHFRHCNFQTIPGHALFSLIFLFRYSKHNRSARLHASSLLFFSITTSCKDFPSHTQILSVSVLKPLHS